MNEKTFIEDLSLKIANYNTPEQAISQANSCESLSNDIYTDSKRFIYELLQNADDASSQNDKLEFQIDFIGQYIIVSHKGDPFSEIDIKSICSIGDGNKKGDENKTGFKGIGFKSVFAHSEFVIIKSAKYIFKFDKNESNKWNSFLWGNENNWKAQRKADNKHEEIKMPWQIIPIWAEIPEELKQLSVFKQDEYNVSTIIRHNKLEELKESLIELFSESQIILFLRSKKIKITINTTKKLILEKSIIDNTTVLKRDNEIISEWLIKNYQFDIPQEIQENIRNDNRYPRKLRESKKTEISFAIQLEKGKLKPADDDKRLIFTYLPTSINYGLPFLVNANFLTDAGRESIHKDLEWNHWLFTQIPIKYFEWISKLADKNSKFNRQFLTVLPQKLNGFNELENKFNDGFNEAIETIAFIPNLQGDLLKVSESLFDETNISDFISKQTLLNYINIEINKIYTVNSFIPYLKPISSLKQLGLKIFKVENLEGFFTSNTFSTEHKVEENFNLISFLHKQANNNQKSENENDWNYQLKYIPFIFDENEKLKKPEDIYFPSVEYTNDFINNISIIHFTVLDCITKDRQITSWLERLGVKEPTDINFIEKTIIGDESFINEENAIEVGRYLFKAKNLLKEEHFSDLQNIKLLTQKGNLINAQECYLSDLYEPKLKLEKFCNIDFFVSEDYYKEKDLRGDWQSFFLRMGVSEDINWKKISIRPNQVDEIDSKFFNQIPKEQLAKDYSYKDHSHNEWPYNIWWYRVYHFTFFKLSNNNYEFSKLFWSRVFKSSLGNEKDLIYGTTGYCEVAYGAVHNIDVDKFTNIGYFNWTTENYNLIPTTNKACHYASKVFNNSINQINEIAGKYLPVLDYDETISPEWQEILKFKEQLKLDDYLTILTEIWQDTELTEDEQKENKKRVFLIYQKLAELYSNLHINDQSKLKDWSNSNKLLARDGKFYLPSELSIVTIDGFNADKLIYTENKVEDSLIRLFDFLGVKVIDKVTPKFSNSMVSQESLRMQLEYIAPLIALVAVEKSKNKKEWEEEFSRICRKLSEITFYETTEILLTYGNEQDQQQRSTYSDGNKFYYVGNWFKPRVLDGLIEPLCKFLNIRYAERILTVLLSDLFMEGLKYLEEKGFDTSLIPESLKNPETVERIPNQTNRQYNQTDEDLGKKGEMIVFEELKQIYSQKYKQPIINTERGFRIDGSVDIIWRNKSENTTANHDFKIIEKEREIYIDSKATTYNKNVEKLALYISGNELDLMEKAEKYLIARVYNAMSDNSTVEFVRMQIDDITT